MGCDGGTIPTRDELVKTKKKPEKRDRDADLATLWHLCAILQTPLEKPIVACQLGRLYNKESVIEFLLDRGKFEEVEYKFKHIKGLKDLKELNLTDNPEYTTQSLTDGYADLCQSKFICPVTGLEMSGKFRFGFIWTCGCVLSERAIKEVKSINCHKCGKPYEEDDVILFNGDHDELDILWMKMEARQQKAKAEKLKEKSKKKKKSLGTTTDDGPDAKQRKIESNVTKVLSDLKKISGKSKSASQDKDNKFKSIQDNPAASRTYKSLFTSCDKAKNQQKAHWVTFNPQYF